MAASETGNAIRFAIVQGKALPQAREQELTWGKLVDRLSTHNRRREKDGPGFVPATFREGHAYRKRENVEAVRLFLIDFDDGTPFEAIRERLQGYAYTAYSTFSHGPDSEKFRVVLPLAQPVPAQEWRRVWEKLTAHFGGGSRV
jgi:hypothetical protein